MGGCRCSHGHRLLRRRRSRCHGLKSDAAMWRCGQRCPPRVPVIDVACGGGGAGGPAARGGCRCLEDQAPSPVTAECSARAGAGRVIFSSHVWVQSIHVSGSKESDMCTWWPRVGHVSSSKDGGSGEIILRRTLSAALYFSMGCSLVSSRPISLAC